MRNFLIYTNVRVVIGLDAELGRRIAMVNEIVTIPEWMLKTLKDGNQLRKAEVFSILGYKSSSSLNHPQMMGLIEKGEFPPISKRRCGFGMNRNILLWNFGDLKKFVREHNKKLTA